MHTHRKRSKAFTLIELMVVILIIAILAALIVPRVMSNAGTAKRAAALSDVRVLESALHQFRLHCDRYPTTEEGLQALRTNPGEVQGWRGPYLDKPIPTDPWGNEYSYEFLDNDEFAVISFGADGASGGDGDNEDIGGETEQ